MISAEPALDDWEIHNQVQNWNEVEKGVKKEKAAGLKNCEIGREAAVRDGGTRDLAKNGIFGKVIRIFEPTGSLGQTDPTDQKIARVRTCQVGHAEV